MKKLMVSVLLIASLLVSGQAFASTIVQPPSSVGTYVDFYHDVRLQWKPVQGAVAYKVYLADGYGTRKGFVLQFTLNDYVLRWVGRQWVIQTDVSTPKIQWYTIKTTSIDKNGNESAPCYTNVNVWR